MKPKLKVMLCHEGNTAMFGKPNWVYERKYDGEYGQLHVMNDRSFRIYGRSGREITKQFPEISLAEMDLPADSIFVGEIYVPDNADIKDKPTTSGRCVLTSPVEIRIRSRLKPAVFMCFDVVRYCGKDRDREPLRTRKNILYAIGDTGPFRVVEYTEDGETLWAMAVASQDEGMVAKRLDSPYENRRSYNWLKLKTWKEEDFRVLGWTSEKREVSALILEGMFKVNFSVPDRVYEELAPRIMANPQRFKVKVKYLHKSESGLRFPVMRDIYEVDAI